jgi:RNA polymerase sigma factor (sigma-70 family)
MEMFDLNKYINDNYILIKESREKAIPFEFDEESVVAVYKLATKNAYRLKVRKQDVEDFVQDCVYHFFSYIVYKYNPNKGVSISTLACVAFTNMYKAMLTKEKTRQALSFEHVAFESEYDDIKIGDLISSSSQTVLEELEEMEYNNFLNKYLYEDKLIYMYYVERKTLREIGKELGYSHETISRRLKTKLDEIKSEWKNTSGYEHMIKK